MVNSRHKGANGEREIVKAFRECWGGQPWGRRGLGHEGSDIITPADFPWTIEVKNHSSARVLWFFKPSEQLKQWWKQAQGNTPKGKSTLLCIKAERLWFAVYNHPFDEVGVSIAVMMESWLLPLSGRSPAPRAAPLVRFWDVVTQNKSYIQRKEK